MISEKIKIDLKSLEEEDKKNFEERLRFIKFWADYIKVHSDEDWSEQQNVIIDGQMNN